MEKAFLRLFILYEVMMVVEVIMREIGENRTIEVDPFHSSLIERVGRDFHYRGFDTRVLHLAEEALDLRRLRCGRLPSDYRGRRTGTKWYPSRPPADSPHGVSIR